MICCMHLMRSGGRIGRLSCPMGSCASLPNLRGGALCGLCWGFVSGL